MNDISFENGRLSLFDGGGSDRVLPRTELDALTLQSAEFADGCLQKVVFTAKTVGKISLHNLFRNGRLGVSDDVPVGRFGDFLMHVHACPVGDWLELDVRAGVTYTVIAVA